MSRRGIYSIILILLAIGVMLIERGIVGGLIGSMLLVIMLFLWVLPADVFEKDEETEKTGPTIPRSLLIFLGIGLGLAAAVIAAYVLPPQYFSYLLIFAGGIIILWFIIGFVRN